MALLKQVIRGEQERWLPLESSHLKQAHLRMKIRNAPGAWGGTNFELALSHYWPGVGNLCYGFGLGRG